MTKETLKQSILTELGEGNIKQTARATFLMKEYGMLFVAFITIMIGMLAMAIIFAAVDDLRSTLYAAHKSGLAGLILLLPYLWFIGMGLFLYLAYNRVCASEHGYKYPLWLIGSGVVAVSIVGGALLYTTGFAHDADQYFATHVPVYSKFGNPQHELWKKPHEGMLAGVILEIATSSLQVRDIRGNVWTMTVSTNTEKNVPVLRERMFIRVIGDRTATGTFVAEEIFPQRPKFRNNAAAISAVRGELEQSERKPVPVRNTR